jgi:predicted nucleotidyltransferase
MISESEKALIIQCAEKYHVSSVYLFGSALEPVESNDIDLGVKGLRPDLFFKFYGELIMQLPKPVDLVDLSEESAVADIIEEEGIRIYG